MDIWGVYLLTVVPLLAVATAAVWVPRPWQVVLLYGGPLLVLLAAAQVPGVERLGYLLVLGTPYALLLALPVLPWRRRWARWAVPLTVLLECAVVVALAEGEAPALFFAAYPAVLALGALAVVVVSSLRRRRDVGSGTARPGPSAGVVGGPPKP
jgi:hypothetical protein